MDDETPDSGKEQRGAEPREVKIKLPIELHLKLHGIKITQGKPISEVVREALEAYFKERETGRRPASKR